MIVQPGWFEDAKVAHGVLGVHGTVTGFPPAALEAAAYAKLPIAAADFLFTCRHPCVQGKQI